RAGIEVGYRAGIERDRRKRVAAGGEQRAASSERRAASRQVTGASRPVHQEDGVAPLRSGCTQEHAGEYRNAVGPLVFRRRSVCDAIERWEPFTSGPCEENVGFIPLIEYSYPFEQADNAAWVANELKPKVLATHGRVAVIDREVLVVLPDTVQPQRVGNLGLFKFEEDK